MLHNNLEGREVEGVKGYRCDKIDPKGQSPAQGFEVLLLSQVSCAESNESPELTDCISFEDS